MTSVVNYLGNLRTESIHISSNDKIVTDAPKAVSYTHLRAHET